MYYFQAIVKFCLVILPDVVHLCPSLFIFSFIPSERSRLTGALVTFGAVSFVKKYDGVRIQEEFRGMAFSTYLLFPPQ
jgi:hypothetical protein